MAKLETKDMQEGKSPFDTSTIERELDDLLRQRKLAREGRGLEELIADREHDEGQTEEGPAPQEKAQEGKRAKRPARRCTGRSGLWRRAAAGSTTPL